MPPAGQRTRLSCTLKDMRCVATPTCRGDAILRRRLLGGQRLENDNRRLRLRLRIVACTSSGVVAAFGGQNTIRLIRSIATSTPTFQVIIARGISNSRASFDTRRTVLGRLICDFSSLLLRGKGVLPLSRTSRDQSASVSASIGAQNNPTILQAGCYKLRRYNGPPFSVVFRRDSPHLCSR